MLESILSRAPTACEDMYTDFCSVMENFSSNMCLLLKKSGIKK